MSRRSRKLSKFSINLPTALAEDLDDLADEMETTRTDVIMEILMFVMENEDLVDLVFGEAEGEEAQSDEEDEEEDESEE
jgi:metal-responsive CopG/Arc/MetJ family transcriptional regulator